MPKVLIAPATLANVEGEWLDLLRENGFETVYPRTAKQLLEDELLDYLKGVDAALAGSEPYSRKVLQANPQLKIVARAGVGYDAVDVKAATEQGTVVTTTPGTNHDAVAEFTFTMMLALAKNLIPLHLSTKSGQWIRQVLVPLRGRTLGIVGLGRIGKAVAIRGKVFGMKMLAYEPFPDQAFVAQQGVTLVPLEQLLRDSDFVTLHVPLSPESKFLINKNTLAQMKPTAYLVNTARGALVHEHDLANALKEKKLAGAGIDVFDEEPPGPSPLFGVDNAIVTPHVAGIDVQALNEMAYSAARSIVTILKGGWPEIEVVNTELKGKLKL